MSEAIEFQQYNNGQLVEPADLSGDVEAIRNLAGLVAYAILGSKSVLPTNPLAVTLSNSTMILTVGGTGQNVIVQDIANSNNARMVDSCPSQNYTVPANSSGSVRNDLISIQYTQTQVNPHNVGFSDGTTQTVYDTLESITYNYGTGQSSPPAGYVAFANVAVPIGATTSSACTITYLIESLAAALVSSLGGLVSNINSQVGAITLAAGAGITIATGPAGTITISATAAASPVLSFNGLTGNLAATSTDGSITLTPSGTNINFKVNFPTVVSTLNTKTGAVTVAQGSGITVTTSGSTITVAANVPNPVASLNGLSGTVTIGSSGATISVTLPGGGVINIEAAGVYTGTGAGTVHTSARIYIGSAVTAGGAGQVALSFSGTVVAGVANVNDSGLSNALTAVVQTVSGANITFNVRTTTTPLTNAGNGVGIYYIVACI